MIRLLLDRKEDEVQITEGVVKAAAVNWSNGVKVMGLLLDRKEDEVYITEGAVVQIANLFNQRIIRLLLDRKGDEV
jgi:hypothetical protein